MVVTRDYNIVRFLSEILVEYNCLGWFCKILIGHRSSLHALKKERTESGPKHGGLIIVRKGSCLTIPFDGSCFGLVLVGD